MNWKHTFIALAGSALAASMAPASALTTVTFDDGAQGWEGPAGGGGRTWITRRLGNDAPALRTRFEDFGITFANASNADFIGDYGRSPAVEIGLDVFTKSIQFSGTPVTRELVLELRDYDNAPDGYPYVSVWFTLGTLDANAAGWQSWSVTIADTKAGELPAGWGGYGAENPDTFVPELPEGRTFADVLAGVDEIAFTTLVPGFAYGFTDFDVAVDNIFINPIAAVPEPASAALFGLGVCALLAGARRGRTAHRA